MKVSLSLVCVAASSEIESELKDGHRRFAACRRTEATSPRAQNGNGLW